MWLQISPKSPGRGYSFDSLNIVNGKKERLDFRWNTRKRGIKPTTLTLFFQGQLETPKLKTLLN